MTLLALFAVVLVTHVHPLDNDADHCQLCIAIHSAAPVAVAAEAVVLVRLGTTVLAVEARPIIRHWYPTHYTRPPPFGC